MTTKNISIKYKPIKIGFLVTEGKVDDLVTVAGINSLLFGGLYNPIIPISQSNNELAEHLLDVFNVDVIYSVNNDEHVRNFAEKYPYLQNPYFISTQLFYEDWESKKNKIMYLDMINIINYYWEKEFRHKEKRIPTYRHVIVKWANNHRFKDLFSLSFGFYPTSFNLLDDYEVAFMDGLHGDVVHLFDEEIFNPDLYTFGYHRSITPLLLTSSELKRYDGKLHGNGFYIGHESDFTDLYLFWNLRAAGTMLEFLPRNDLQHFSGIIQSQLKRVDALPKHTGDIEHVTAYCQHQYYDDIKELIKDIQSDKQITPFPADIEVPWDRWNFRPYNFYFNESETLASVVKDYEQYNVSFNLPDMEILKRQEGRIELQSFGIWIRAKNDKDNYPEHTLLPPEIRKLNAFYGRHIIGHTFKVKVEASGIRVIIRGKDYSLSLTPISYQSIINGIFDLAGMKVKVSQPGIITKQILQRLGGLQWGRILKITGVRRLLNSLKKDDAITQSAATQLILRKTSFTEDELRAITGNDFDTTIPEYFTQKLTDKRFVWKESIKKTIDIDDERLKIIFEGDFRKFENIFSPYGFGEKLTTGRAFRLLLKKELFRAGLELVCNHCRLISWLSLREIDDYWICNYCGGNNQTSLHLNNEGNWKYRKSGLFAKDNNQEGAIPVILTLLQFHKRFDQFGYGYSPALRVQGEKVNCEIDLCILQYGIGDSIEVGIAECKSEGGKITQEDVINLKSVRDRLNEVGISCVLIFSKTANRFDIKEIELFKTLDDDNIRCVLLLNKELEPFDLYEEYEQHELVYKQASTLEYMGWNSRKVYLKRDN